MVEVVQFFDSKDFAKSVEAALISGVPSRIDELIRCAQAHHPTVDQPSLLLIVITVCQQTGRTKMARKWLQRLEAGLSSAVMVPALMVAMRSGYADVALRLFDKLSEQEVARPGDSLALAQEAIALAMRLRLPRGRHGAWIIHHRLLQTAESLLLDLMQQPLSAESQEQANLSLDKVHKLLGTKAVPRC